MTIARVYEYGLLPPTANHDLVVDQMRSAHRYRNLLIEIERERRVAVAAAMAAHADVEPIAAEVDRLAAAREIAFVTLKRTNSVARARVDQPEQRAALRAIGAELREARARLKAAKAAIKEDPAVIAAIHAADEHSKDRVRKARAACGTYWSTYLLAEAAVDQARKSPTPPKFAPWTGEGRVSVQLQGGIALSEIWGGDSQIEIGPVDPMTHAQETTRGDRRRLSRTVLRMRVQSDERAKPVWAEWPMILHRPLPEGCRIKVATVHRRKRDCRRWDWHVTIQVELADTWTRGTPGEGVVALNLGYTNNYPHLQGAIRSGYLVDDRGVTREVAVARSVIDRVEKSEAIRSQRDKNLDAMRAELVGWMHANEAALPEWLVEKTILAKVRRDSPTASESGHAHDPGYIQGRNASQMAHEAGRDAEQLSGSSEPHDPRHGAHNGDSQASHEPGQNVEVCDDGQQAQDAGQDSAIAERRRVWHIAQWRSAERYRALAFAWRKQRWDGDAAGYDLIEAWRYRDEHLQRYEAGMLRGALLDRRERYRILAAELARTYRTLVVHDTDLRELQKLPSPTSTDVKIPVARRNQRHAAGSILRGALENAFKRSGGNVVEVSDDKITSTCHGCGSLEAWDRIAERSHTCGSCGITWDQDENACRNMLARERSGAGSSSSAARPAKAQDSKESRSERLRRGRRKEPTEEVARDA